MCGMVVWYGVVGWSFWFGLVWLSGSSGGWVGLAAGFVRGCVVWLALYDFADSSGSCGTSLIASDVFNR